MWRCGVLDLIFFCESFFVKLKLTWNGRTVEGDSPVSMCFLGFFFLFLEYDALDIAFEFGWHQHLILNTSQDR